MSSVAKTWNEVAASYDASRIKDTVYLSCCESVVRRLGPVHGRVLDAGCGTGIVTQLLGPCDLHAVDYSEQSLAVLKQKLPSAQTRLGDIRALPYQNDYFDAVLCANALQHFSRKDQTTAVSELMRVLKPGGKFAFSMHHYSRHKARAGWIKEGRPGEPGIDYIYRYTADEVRALIPGAHITSCGFYGWSRYSRFLSRWFGGMAAWLGAGHMLVAAGARIDSLLL